MSWQQYVDQNLIGTKLVSKAAIHGHDGTLWATSAGFSINGTEIKNLIAGFKDATGLRSSGLHIGGTKYFLLRADDRSIYGKQGAGGVIAVKTKMAVIIGVYGEGIQPGQATKTVEDLADYLISHSYVSVEGPSCCPPSRDKV
ncbi:Profilin/allergen [Gonapodya prolifera JEL478]|uniref:Profilin n=1 Tax=Gonapodya prolifera (strain JEL478) TaxID=1344416 RepID=A0A139AX35_GONPJ|nr:Profilin/allergen [Gonapodya prolifera JEL478]|eukprot:KXS21311.1 Profilin/allergen [Gonapodya prolifera JEL478]